MKPFSKASLVATTAFIISVSSANAATITRAGYASNYGAAYNIAVSDLKAAANNKCGRGKWYEVGGYSLVEDNNGKGGTWAVRLRLDYRCY